MPWKKNFDVEDAVESAMELFWEKGFEATSITDLTKATGVQRQSLYNAVGDKRDLFVRSLLKYDSKHRKGMLAALESRGKPLESIRDLFASVVDNSTNDERRRGCFLVNTALGMQGHDEEVQTLVNGALADFRSFFERLIEHGKVRKEIPQHVESSAAASGLLAVIVGMRVMARGVVDETQLRQMADQALRLIS